MRIAGALLLCVTGAAAAAEADPTRLSVEELLQVSVYTASKFAQKTIEAPASVTIITAEDIRTYGYRTLADALKSVRGFFVTYDRNYNYLGVRGFERPGDYDSRVLLMLDGLRLNDTIYDTAGIGTEFPVDVDLIERLEIVRGPGSAIYGSNAFFGVINVITRRGRDVGALEASAEGASFGTDKERLTSGGRWDNGLEWLLSASRYRSEGRDHYYSGYDAPATNNGWAVGLDGDQYEKALGRLSAAGLSVTAGYSRREKHIPTASYGTVFNDGRLRTTDQWEFLDLDYQRQLSRTWELAPRLSYSRYTYDGDYPFDYPPLTLNRDLAHAQWWASEVRLVGRFARHKLLAGVEYQDNFQQDQLNYDEAPFASYLDDRRQSQRSGVYVEDEAGPFGAVRVSAGLRFDHYSTAGDAVNPRLALVWTPLASTSVKALAGSAFRAPNNYELYYGDNATIIPNPDLDAEEVETYELVTEHYFDPNFRLTADLYHSRIRNLIDQVTEPAGVIFRNVGRIESRGAELELERVWTGDVRARISYAWQETKDLATDLTLTNSPRHLAKLNVALPVVGRFLGTGTEVQYLSERKTVSGGMTGDAVVANLTLFSRPFAQRLEFSASVYNLLDRDYADPARPEHAPAIDAIGQDGRSLRLKLTYGL